MIIYLISSLLLIVMLLGKMYFVSIEGIGNLDILRFLSPAILMVFLFLGTVSFFKSSVSRHAKDFRGKFGNSTFTRVCLILCLLVVGMSFYININKKALTWDSVALYDARAKFLLSGINFSQMVELSKYDPQNSYYYVLYPPYTSVIHFFWYKLGIPVPTG